MAAFQQIMHFAHALLNERLLIRLHGSHSLLGHPHERQLQPQRPQQVLVMLLNIKFVCIMHVQFRGQSVLGHPHRLTASFTIPS